MRKCVLTSIALLTLLSYSLAEQNLSVEPSGQPWVFSSDESSTGAYLGVDINDVTTERLSALKLKEEKGVEVTMVDQDAPAGKAGIKEHDVILTMNGTAIESGAQLRRMIHETPAGRIVTFGLSRDGQPVIVKVQLGDKHKEFAMTGPNVKEFNFTMPDIHIPNIEIPSMNMVVVTQSLRSGLMLENITPQLGDFFGVKNGNGVLIRSVEKGSRAEKAGFRAGDIIVKVNDQAVHDTSDFTHAVKSRTGGSVNVGVVRDKKEQNLNLTLPESKESGDLMEDESDDSMIDANSRVELGELEDEIAKVRPEMELAVKGAVDAAEEVRKSLCGEQKNMTKQAAKLRAAIKPQVEQFKQQQEKFKMELDRLRQQMSADWL
jgi:predicted metalloprotease with PDZ domain